MFRELLKTRMGLYIVLFVHTSTLNDLFRIQLFLDIASTRSCVTENTWWKRALIGCE